MSRVTMSRRRFLVLALSSMSGAALAACGATPTPTATPVPPTATKPPAPTATAVPAAPATTAPAPTATKAPATATPVPPTPTKAPAKPAGRLIIAQGIDPRTLQPYDSTTQQEHNVSTQIIEKLMMYDGSNKMKPNLATEWKFVNDTTFQMKLRQGVKFTNGEEFDADAAKYSLDWMIKAPAYVRYVEAMDKVVVVDKYTINVVTKWPSPSLLSSLARGSFVIPPKYHAQVGNTEFGKKPIGTGPFKFVEWVKDDHITLEANVDYWGGAPKVQTVIFKPLPEPAARIAALEAGDVDLIGDVPIPSVERLQKNPNLSVYTVDGMRTMKLTLDQMNPGPMQDIRVRQAMNYAINVDEIINVIFKGQASKLNCQILTPAYFGYNPNLKPYPYDPAKAKQLLAEAGYPNGLELEFKYPTGRYAQDKEVCEAISAQLEKGGFKIKQVVMESGKFLTLQNERKLGPFFFAGSLTVPDALYQLNQSISTANYTYYKNPKFDELIAKSDKTLDEKEREQLFWEASKIICEDPAHVYLYVAKDVYASKKSVKGFAPRPDQWYDLLNVSVS